jgi:hypothetical protein
MIVTFSAIGCRIIVHDQTDVLEKRAERVILLHRARQFGEVLQPPSASTRSFRLQDAVVYPLSSKIVRTRSAGGRSWHQSRQRATIAHEIEQRIARACGVSSSVSTMLDRRQSERNQPAPGHGGGPSPASCHPAALGDVVDPLKRQIVAGWLISRR